MKSDLSMLFFFNPESIISADKNSGRLLCMAAVPGVVFELEGVCSQSLQQVMPVKGLQASQLYSGEEQMVQRASCCMEQLSEN